MSPSYGGGGGRPPMRPPMPGGGGGGAPEGIGDVGPLEKEPTGPAGLEAAKYHGGEATCDKCEHFDGQRCKLFKVPVDPDGHCDKFEARAEAPPEETAELPGQQATEPAEV